MSDRYAGMELEEAILEVLVGTMRLSAATIRDRLVAGGYSTAEQLPYHHVYSKLRVMERHDLVVRRTPPGRTLWGRA